MRILFNGISYTLFKKKKSELFFIQIFTLWIVGGVEFILFCEKKNAIGACFSVFCSVPKNSSVMTKTSSSLTSLSEIPSLNTFHAEVNTVLHRFFFFLNLFYFIDDDFVRHNRLKLNIIE